MFDNCLEIFCNAITRHIMKQEIYLSHLERLFKPLLDKHPSLVSTVQLQRLAVTSVSHAQGVRINRCHVKQGLRDDHQH